MAKVSKETFIPFELPEVNRGGVEYDVKQNHGGWNAQMEPACEMKTASEPQFYTKGDGKTD